MQTSIITITSYANPSRGEWPSDQMADGVGPLTRRGNKDNNRQTIGDDAFPAHTNCPGGGKAYAAGLNPAGS